MGKPIRPGPVKPTSPFAMRFLPKGELNASEDLAPIHLTLLDLAAPGARLTPAALDELLEALEVALDAGLHDAQRVGDVLHDALGLVVDLQHHARPVVVDAVEGHHAGVPGAAAARPRDALVGPLLRDLGDPLLFLAADGGFPLQALVVELANLLDAFHELREVLELSPLVYTARSGAFTSIDCSMVAIGKPPFGRVRGASGRKPGASEHFLVG